MPKTSLGQQNTGILQTLVTEQTLPMNPSNFQIVKTRLVIIAMAICALFFLPAAEMNWCVTRTVASTAMASIAGPQRWTRELRAGGTSNARKVSYAQIEAALKLARVITKAAKATISAATKTRGSVCSLEKILPHRIQETVRSRQIAAMQISFV